VIPQYVRVDVIPLYIYVRVDVIPLYICEGGCDTTVCM